MCFQFCLRDFCEMLDGIHDNEGKGRIFVWHGEKSQNFEIEGITGRQCRPFRLWYLMYSSVTCFSVESRPPKYGDLWSQSIPILRSHPPIAWVHPSLFKEKWKMGSLPGLNIDSVEKQATWDPGRGKHVKKKIHQLQLEDVTVSGDWHSVLRSSQDYQTKTKLKVP